LILLQVATAYEKTKNKKQKTKNKKKQARFKTAMIVCYSCILTRAADFYSAEGQSFFFTFISITKNDVMAKTPLRSPERRYFLTAK
jgi:hypothetical protein